MSAGAKYVVVLLTLLGACVEQPLIPRVAIPTLDDPATGDFVSVSAGLEHTCALTTDGTAYCWGSNEFGQLGVAADTVCLRDDREVPCRLRPAPVAGGLKFSRLSAGGLHTCGIALDGRVFCWGDNLRGELGDPVVRSSAVPIPVVNAPAFTDVVAGGEHTCGLRTDGFAFCWGFNESGQLGIATVGLGTAVPESVRTTLRFASLVAGAQRTCARAGDGATFCWGATWFSTVNGAEVTRNQSSPLRVQAAPPFKSLAAGTTTTCGITAGTPTSAENQAHCWEANTTGGIGDGTVAGSTTPRQVQGGLAFVSVASGAFHTCGIADSGLAYCWGGDAFGQLGAPSSILAFRCSPSRIPCVTGPIQVSGWRRFSQLTTGQGNHTCGLTVSGNIYCWGAGGLGQRGDGRTSSGEWAAVKTAPPAPL